MVMFGQFQRKFKLLLQARPLTQQEMADPTLNLIVAEKMAAVHTMNIPINKEPRWLWDTMNK